nr:protein FAR1-RELATED SEQUENCE 5-like [Ipomoea batatas]
MEAIELFEDDNNMDGEDDNNMDGEGNVMAEENIVPAPNDAEGNIESSGVHSWQGDNNYFIPECCEKEKPIIRQQFASMEEGVAFYKLYAVEAGFDVRCSIVRKNKEGYIEVRHAFVVLNDNDAEMIPTKYVLDRWKKNSCIQETSSTCKGGSGRSSREEENSKLAPKLCKEFYNYLALSKENTVKMQEMMTFMMENKEKMVTRNAKAQDKSKNSELLEIFYGAQTSSIITVKPPQLSKNKGSGKRLKSAREKAIEKKRSKTDENAISNCLLNPNSKENPKNKEKA